MRQRHALYLSAAMTGRLALMAETRRLSKAELLERALQAYLTQDADGRLTHLLTQQQERNERTLGRVEPDAAIATELLATFLRYFLTITRPCRRARPTRRASWGSSASSRPLPGSCGA